MGYTKQTVKRSKRIKKKKKKELREITEAKALIMLIQNRGACRQESKEKEKRRDDSVI